MQKKIKFWEIVKKILEDSKCEKNVSIRDQRIIAITRTFSEARKIFDELWKKYKFSDAIIEMETEGSSSFDWDGSIKKFKKEFFERISE